MVQPVSVVGSRLSDSGRSRTNGHVTSADTSPGGTGTSGAGAALPRSPSRQPSANLVVLAGLRILAMFP
jgi:hypothetical protein